MVPRVAFTIGVYLIGRFVSSKYLFVCLFC